MRALIETAKGAWRQDPDIKMQAVVKLCEKFTESQLNTYVDCCLQLKNPIEKNQMLAVISPEKLQDLNLDNEVWTSIGLQL
jgi:hypothetical protein